MLGWAWTAQGPLSSPSGSRAGSRSSIVRDRDPRAARIANRRSPRAPLPCFEPSLSDSDARDVCPRSSRACPSSDASQPEKVTPKICRYSAHLKPKHLTPTPLRFRGRSLFGLGLECFLCDPGRVRHGIRTALVSGTNCCKKIPNPLKTHPVRCRNVL
jgi:hypothetical protein